MDGGLTDTGLRAAEQIFERNAFGALSIVFGIAIIALFVFMMRRLDKERLRNDELQEKRIAEMQAALGSVTKAVDVLEHTAEAFAEVSRSRGAQP